jgi:hypothetical protein
MIERLAAGTVLALLAAMPLAGQQPGRNAGQLPPHVVEHLWPERELSPTEQEFKDRVIVIRDSLGRIRATASQLQRQQRSGAGIGVIRSSARALADDCARGRRSAESMAGFAATLTTNDAEWGLPAVLAYRAALGELDTGLRQCSEAIAGEVERSEPDVDRVLTIATAAHTAVTRYDRAELDLLRTLKIRVDPGSRSSSASR